MKRFLLPLLLSFLFAEAFSQIIARESGIGIQGIARDDENNARSNQDITLRFSLYYFNENNVETQVFIPKSENLRTDAFGVFSHVLEISSQYYPVIAYYEVYLKIEAGTMVISNEKLKQVPYAISAGNGVPTGSIMPFVGENAPPGWVMCQGQDISNVAGSASLRLLLGKATVPDLRGMFLRGTGTNEQFGKQGPALLDSQQDMMGAHSHDAGGMKTKVGDGGHEHRLPTNGNPGAVDRTITYYTIASKSAQYFNFTTEPNTGQHTHDIVGNTAESGGLETRPINVGVNYIIKL